MRVLDDAGLGKMPSAAFGWLKVESKVQKVQFRKELRVRKFLALLLVPACAGCLTAYTPAIARWSIECSGRGVASESAKFGVARPSSVVVRAPYNDELMVVLRADGSVAFDPLNLFASTPAAMLKGVVFDSMVRSGLFKSVVSTSSVASSEIFVEVEISKLALDCRQEGQRNAVAAISVRVLDGREIVAESSGAGSFDASTGNYGAAFSGAVSSALVAAFAEIK